MEKQKNIICNCDPRKPKQRLFPLSFVSIQILDVIKKDYPNIEDYDYICAEDLNEYRAKYIKGLLEKHTDGDNKDVIDVIESIQEKGLISENIDEDIDENRTFADMVSDKLATFAGSWKFIIIFCSIILLWIISNSIFLIFGRFDPYPFILLNLALSCIAALQAPIIMMSQNRQEKRDRIRSVNDYKINLKAELEIRMLHEKLDSFIKNNWQMLMEIQKVQLDMVKDIDPK